jgi:hypothetical protein
MASRPCMVTGPELLETCEPSSMSIRHSQSPARIRIWPRQYCTHGPSLPRRGACIIHVRGRVLRACPAAACALFRAGVNVVGSGRVLKRAVRPPLRFPGASRRLPWGSLPRRNARHCWLSWQCPGTLAVGDGPRRRRHTDPHGMTMRQQLHNLSTAPLTTLDRITPQIRKQPYLGKVFIPARTHRSSSPRSRGNIGRL